MFKVKPFKPPKCYLDTEEVVTEWIAKELGGDWEKFRKIFKPKIRGEHWKTRHQALDTSIMTIADDIAYGVHDLEDVISLDLVKREEFSDDLTEKILEPFTLRSDGMKYNELLKALFCSEDYSRRKQAIGSLVNYFVQNVDLVGPDKENFSTPIFTKRAKLNDDAEKLLESLKDFVIMRVIKTPNVQQLEFKGRKIVTELFEAFMTDPEKLLTPREWKKSKEAACGGDTPIKRVVCDYIAGMTDEYATKRYQQLFSPRVGSVFDHL